MEKQHLTYFKIENFKRFDSFEMSNLGQFNLIVGDNNVGKTSVLEALTFDNNVLKFVANYLNAFLNRGYRVSEFEYVGRLKTFKIPATNFWQTFFKDISKELSFFALPDHSSFSVSFLEASTLKGEEKEEIIKASIGKSIEYWLKITYPKYGDFQLIPAYIPAFLEDKEINWLDTAFIPANLTYDDNLVRYFYKFFNEHKSTRRELEKNLTLIIPNLEELRTHRFSEDREMIAFSLKNDDNLQPLTRYGDGTIKVVRLLMVIIANQDHRLMIDEIGSGIHFTRLKEYWKTVLQLCAKYNVQLFATTHSLECQQAFIEALEDPEMQQYQKDARNITLLENRQGEVKAFTYNFDEFEFSLANGINTRGGER